MSIEAPVVYMAKHVVCFLLHAVNFSACWKTHFLTVDMIFVIILNDIFHLLFVDLICNQNLPSNAAIGTDPWCVSVETYQRWEQAFLKKKQKLIQLSTNMVDIVWKDRPPAEILPVNIHPPEFAGCTVAEKLKDLRAKLIREKAYGIIISSLDEVCTSTSVFYKPPTTFYVVILVLLQLLNYS